MTPTLRSLALATALALAMPVAHVSAAPFTFQGHLTQSGTPLNGSANLVFKLYDAQSGGSQLGGTISETGWPVADGVFTIDLDFTGVVFNGNGRWLQVEVNGTPLGGRIEVLPAPLASSSNALRGFNVAASTPTNGQVLKWNGSAWAPSAQASYVAGNGLTLSGNIFSVNFAGSGTDSTVARSDHDHYGDNWTGNSNTHGLQVFNSAPLATSAIQGFYNGTGVDVSGVYGESTNGFGVQGFGKVGVRGASSVTAGTGILGLAFADTGETYGVFAESSSPAGYGVMARNVATTGNAIGMQSESASSNGIAIRALANHTGNGTTFGVHAISRATEGIGVHGEATATTGNTVGVRGTSASSQGIGVHGTATSATGNTVGVRGEGRFGMVANGTETGLDAVATNSVGQAVGVQASSGSPDGAGVFAQNSANTGNAYAVYAQSNSPAGTAVVGDALATSGSNRGVLARTASAGGVGLRAENSASTGSGSGNALVAVGNMPSGDTLVVEANGTSNAWAIRARSAGTQVINAELTTPGTSGATISATVNSASGRAGQFFNWASGGTAASFVGNVDVSGTLSKGGGSFKIDHPLDPANKYLLHSFVESPDMMNIYNGNIVTDAQGYATIELPEWFEALNRDFRYQLTVVGQFAQAIVSKKVEQNRFEIRTNLPRVEVSWQVTGIRHDAWAEQNRIPVELEKTKAERGKYLHPQAHGVASELGIVPVTADKE